MRSGQLRRVRNGHLPYLLSSCVSCPVDRCARTGVVAAIVRAESLGTGRVKFGDRVHRAHRTKPRPRRASSSADSPSCSAKRAPNVPSAGSCSAAASHSSPASSCSGSSRCALMVSDRETHRVYKALHRPLTVWGVDRRLFFLALMMGAAMFNLFYSFLAALLTFASLYGFARWSTKRDPQMLRILLSSVAVPRALRRGEAHARACRGVVNADAPRDSAGLRRGRQRQCAARVVGVRRRRDLRDQGRRRRRRLSPPRPGLRRPRPRAAAPRRAPVRSRAAAAG